VPISHSLACGRPWSWAARWTRWRLGEGCCRCPGRSLAPLASGRPRHRTCACTPQPPGAAPPPLCALRPPACSGKRRWAPAGGGGGGGAARGGGRACLSRQHAWGPGRWGGIHRERVSNVLMVTGSGTGACHRGRRPNPAWRLGRRASGFVHADRGDHDGSASKRGNPRSRPVARTRQLRPGPQHAGGRARDVHPVRSRQREDHRCQGELPRLICDQATLVAEQRSPSGPRATALVAVGAFQWTAPRRRMPD
jgi:hypothetical protein